MNLTITETQDILKKAVKATINVTMIPNNLRKAIISLEKDIGEELTKRLLEILDRWTLYCKANKVRFDNVFILRFHLQEFAYSVFNETPRQVELFSIDIDMEELSYKGIPFNKILSNATNPNILYDNDIAIYGGVARTLLKIFVGVPIESELPLYDVDVIARIVPGIEKKMESYGIDLAGAKMTARESLLDEFQHVLSSGVDCTMNETAIIGGKLFYSRQAYEDIWKGEATFIPKNDSLFGVSAVGMSDGSVYLHKTSIYRGLAYLVREKISRFRISNENLQQELPLMWRYWIIILFVKIIPMKNVQARDSAVLNWYYIARDLQATNTKSPMAFLKELLSMHPEMVHLIKPKTKSETPQQQLQWLITKLCDTAVEKIFPNDVRQYPEARSFMNISLSNSRTVIGLKSFWKYIETLK